jgi:hypothetical protein
MQSPPLTQVNNGGTCVNNALLGIVWNRTESSGCKSEEKIAVKRMSGDSLA